MNTNTTVWRGTIAACVALVALAGCTTPDNGPTESPSRSTTTSASPTSSPTPTVDPAIAAAEAAILEAYYGYWAAKVTSYADPTQSPDPNLARFAIETALTDAQASLAQMRNDGIRTPGEPVLSPQVDGVRLDEPPSATIRDCIDVANWQPIFSATGDSAVAPGQDLRVVAVATARVFEGQWVLDTYRIERDRSC